MDLLASDWPICGAVAGIVGGPLPWLRRLDAW
jgi:hypothetical protein